ncbi:MAG: hypothetical protein NTX00_01405 [Candidatus Parcubacteria bacterium]|nr:hypothetical protein [Candidatus Parcubacteria bacterium]
MQEQLLENRKELIKGWFEKSKKIEDNNSFDKFIYLWISFNAFYVGINSDAPYKSEKELINKIIEEYKQLFFNLVQDMPVSFRNFQKYIEGKIENRGFIQDLRFSISEESHKKRYNNLKALCEFLKCVYQVRCNLFHGGKLLEDGQNETIVRLAYESLIVFLEKIYKKYNII